jgi:hypothetical protein
MKITFTVDKHQADGFTLWAYTEDKVGFYELGRVRYLGYTITEAKRLARQTIKENGRLSN